MYIYTHTVALYHAVCRAVCLAVCITLCLAVCITLCVAVCVVVRVAGQCARVRVALLHPSAVCGVPFHDDFTIIERTERGRDMRRCRVTFTRDQYIQRTRSAPSRPSSATPRSKSSA